VRLRYRSPAVPCRLRDGALELGEPFAGVAPGQQAALLQGDVVVGYATIST
jgi:tRNA U34 2-thiouridine synthase MnmA/TrmU